ncbi:hemerythrin domain-containing protein [Algoriphagus sp. CAU 1675]|uniref:hemerythrin domain-containing protein n=1 Tax=Algoriphagus sp. CAU 1675 TaxID=3032597 RepID=UPI0023DC5E98|nr:hemerythrin domain-containing protein [Algoriphagus sp. CAU 1675]MDF2156510.1 hemerythrin domain-containing protein [Algoriphagus sp. CAU 1675]
MDQLANQSILEIQSLHSLPKEFFLGHGIDPESMGNLTAVDLCESQHLNLGKFLNALKKAFAAKLPEIADLHTCPSDLLAHYFEVTQHAWIREKRFEILQSFQDFKNNLVKESDEFHQLEDLFSKASEELILYLEREELIIFPYINTIAQNPEKLDLFRQPPFDQIAEKIHLLMKEHDRLKEQFDRISQLTDHYAICEEFGEGGKELMDQLREFHLHLSEHLALEHRVLFPRVREPEGFSDSNTDEISHEK